jgi:hypothetical protein
MTRTLIVFLALGLMAVGSRADDDVAATPLPAAATGAAVTPPPPLKLIAEPAWSPKPPRARAIPPTLTTPIQPAPANQDATVKYEAEGKWDLAGYNNDEVIYTIFITSHDPRIIRCAVELKGFYYEDGEKHDVSDRQSGTVFPDQRVQLGNWQGMDRKSGATYAVKCHAA